jgi:hypothetical protein
MMRFKLGALLGFAAGWAVGSGRAAEFWEEVQRRSSNRTSSAAATNGSDRSYDGTMLADDRTLLPDDRTVASA